MAYEYERFRELTLLVQGIKRSIEDRPPHRVGRISVEQWREAIFAFEEVRVILRQANRRPREDLDLDLVNEAHEKLIQIASNTTLMDMIGSMPLRLLAAPREIELMETFRGRPIGEALYAALDLSAGLTAGPKQQALDLDSIVGAERLRNIVPDQKIAPAKFGIEQNRIIVIPQRHVVPEADREAADAARLHLHNSGQRIIDSLSASNCDRRLIEAVEQLQAALAEPKNVIELGLTNLSCEAICGAAKEELPDAVCGMIKGHTAAIGMFVAQFPEWQKFAENAAAVELTVADVEEINRAASQIIAQIENNPEVADKDVPKTIKAIRALTSDPSTTARKAAFALLRTVENFVSTVFSYGTNFIGKTADKTSGELSSAIAKASAGILVAAAIAGASQMTGVTGRIAEATWIKNALEIVQKQAGHH